MKLSLSAICCYSPNPEFFREEGAGGGVGGGGGGGRAGWKLEAITKEVWDKKLRNP